MIHPNRILETMCRIRQLCTELDQVMCESQREGRMATMQETQQADKLSTELMELIRELPENPCEKIESEPFKALAVEALQQAAELLKKLLAPAPAGKAVSRPRRAAVGRVSAYATY